MSDSSKPIQNGSLRFWSYALLILALSCAWLVSVHPYLRVADDFIHARDWERGAWQTFLEIFARRGIQRSANFLLIFMPIAGLPLAITSYVTALLHFATTIIFFEAAWRLLRSVKLALFLSVIFGVYPAVYGAFVWATGIYVVVMLGLFLGNFLYLHSRVATDEQRPFRTGMVSFLLSFLTCLCGEQLIFASMLCGVLALVSLRGFGSIRSALRFKWAGVLIGPAAGAIVYLLVLVLTKPTTVVDLTPLNGKDFYTLTGTPALSTINVNTLLSVWCYQYRHFFIFEPWVRPGALGVAFAEWTVSQVICAAALSIGIVVALLKTGQLQPANSKCSPPPLAVFFVLGVMMLAVSGVYALAGGFSYASRQQYVPFALFLLFVGLTLQRFCPLIAIRRAWPLGMTVLLAIGILTTWLVVGINRYELRRYHALTDFISANGVSGDIRLKYEPEIYHYWPLMEPTISHSYRLSWVINTALTFNGKPDVSIVDSPGAPTVLVESTNNQFRVRLLDL